MKIRFKNIKELIQVRDTPISYVSGKEMKVLPTIKNAYLIVENGRIADFGKMKYCPQETVDEEIDATGKMILPTWCDSHTHIVYAGNREGEFIDRINGLTYEEIAQKGGGILNSAKVLQQTSEEELYEQSKARLEEVIQQGTGAIEIKSGYGLTPEAELKMLRVIKRLRENYPIPIKATFLAAHAVPHEYKGKKEAFLDLMLEEVLPNVAQEQLAEYIDVFCEEGYFSVEDTDKVLTAAAKYGLRPKIHVNQFYAIGGVQIGVKHNALSVDHLEVMRAEDVQALKGTNVMPVALPGCSFFLGIPYTPARKLIDEGLPLALASDYNPGSAPSGNMNFAVSTACIKMKMTPEEAINAGTLNGAYAMGLEKEVGSISVGKRANFMLTKPINSYGVLPYSFGANLIEEVYIDGETWKEERINHSINLTNSTYSPPNKEHWKGRKTKPEKGIQYWYQAIDFVDAEHEYEKPEIAILGYACDEGVRRNQGRVGAKGGPDSIRQQIAKLSWHHKIKVTDVGNVLCENHNLEQTQEKLSSIVEELISNKVFPILIGGGHDMAYGHFKGIWRGLKNTSPKIGIINFDAHFDLRPVETQPNSGTPFNQILDEFGDAVEYLAIGIQPASNTKELFDMATEKDVMCILSEECELENMQSVVNLITLFMSKQDALYITIDMDGFSSAYAPGVSAPSPLGMEPSFVIKVLEHIFQSGKVVSLDMAEVNPVFDLDSQTAKLAARLVDVVVRQLGA